MRIALVTTNGINPLFKNWPEYILARFRVARGHDVTIYRHEPVDAPAAETIDGIAVRRVGRGPGGYSADLARLIAAEPPPDVVDIFHIRNLIA